MSLAVAPFFQAFRAAVLPAPSHSTVASAGAVTSGGVLSLIVKVLLPEVPVLLQASVEVQWALITTVPPQPGVLLSCTYTGAAVVPQVSLALAPLFQAFRAAVLPAPSHSTVTSAGAVTSGGVLSLIVKVLLPEVPVLLQASVEVQWALITTVPPQPGVLLSCTYTGAAVVPQLSLALAPLFQAFRAAVLPAPSHSTVTSAGAVTSGGVLSLIVKVLLPEVPVLLQASVEVQWALITTVPPQPGVLLSCTYTGAAVVPQVSLALAPLFQAFRAAVLPAPSHSTVTSAGAVTSGGVLSLIVKVLLPEVPVLLQASVEVQCAWITMVPPQPGVLLS